MMLCLNIKVYIKKFYKEYRKRVIIMTNDNMEDFLNNFKKKKVNPTAAIVDPVEDKKESSDQLSKIVKKKEKMEDTHTRRTNLIKNKLLNKLDEKSEKINNTGFKTEFINYVIEKGLEELDEFDN